MRQAPGTVGIAVFDPRRDGLAFGHARGGEQFRHPDQRIAADGICGGADRRLVEQVLVHPIPHGEIRLVNAIIRPGDIEQSIEADAALLLHWHAAFDNLPDMILMCSRDGRVVAANEAFREATGCGTVRGQLFDDTIELECELSFAQAMSQIEQPEVSDLAFAGILSMAEVGQRQPVSVRFKMTPATPDRPGPIFASLRVQGNAAQDAPIDPGEDKFRRLAEAAPVAIYQADPNGDITYVNKQWALRLGYPLETLLGSGWRHMVVDAQVYRDDPPWIGFTPQNDTRIRTNRLRTHGGEIMEFQTLNQAEFSSDGVLLGFVGVMFDVTEQAKAMREYEHSEQRFSALASLSSVGIFRADAGGGLFFANSKWSDISGLGLDDARGEGWLAAVHPEDRDRVILAWQDVIANASGQARFRFRRPDGTVRHVEVVATAEAEVGGHVHGYIGIVVDVTHNEEIAERLRQREHQLAILAENSRDPIFRLDLEGNCLYASPAAEAMLVSTAQDVVGTSMIAPCHRDDLPEFLQSFRSLTSGAKDRSEVTFRARSFRPPFDYHWLEAQGALVRNTEGDPSEVIVSLRDVTGQKRLEGDLREARQAAERSAASKATFLANMSHEIRTPMNGVLGYADLLADSALDPEQRERVELIRDCGRSMMHLLNDILDLSKIEAGQMTVARQPFDLAHLLNSSAKLVQPMASRKGLELAIDLAADLPGWINADRTRLRQILSNLLSNAVKFTAEGSVCLGARREGDDLVVDVQDTGCGIAAERLDDVFQSFAQESELTHRQFGGTGLGLAISRSLAQIMDGSLVVESRRNTGSTFTLRIPCQPAEAPETLQAKPGSSERPLKFDGKILVAEDHEVNRALISAMLEKIGVEFDVVANGQVALDAVREAIDRGQGYKLVLMDIEMPVCDGLECTARLREAGIGCDALPIIALTANVFREDVASYLEAGMQAHLAKPLRLDELVAQLREWS